MTVGCSANALSLITPLVGVALGGAIGFLSARRISERTVRMAAAARLRAAFAPALAQIEMHRLHGSTHDQPDVDGFFKTALLEHAAAIEEFRPFVSAAKQSSFDKSWNRYVRSVRDQVPDSWDSATTVNGEHPWHVVVKNIRDLLSHTEA